MRNSDAKGMAIGAVVAVAAMAIEGGILWNRKRKEKKKKKEAKEKKRAKKAALVVKKEKEYQKEQRNKRQQELIRQKLVEENQKLKQAVEMQENQQCNPTAPNNNISDTDGSMECIICLDESRKYALLPCGHFCLCENCVARIPNNKCPVCRNEIQDILRIYD